MQKVYCYESREIELVFGNGVVRITSPETLWEFINQNPVVNTRKLVVWSKNEHEKLHQRPLKIGDNSLIAEIWGHIYFDYWILRTRFFASILARIGIYNRLLEACEAIDCGEAHLDHNRWLWDFLSFLVPVGGWMLPKKG